MAAASRLALDENVSKPTYTDEQYELCKLLSAAATRLAPGWLGISLADTDVSTPLGGDETPVHVRVGTAEPLDGARFPAVVPLLTHGHLAIDMNARDPRVRGLLRAVVLRLLATAPAGTLRVLAVDAGPGNCVFQPFSRLTGTALMPPPVTDHDGLRAVLDEAEQWVRLASNDRQRPSRDRMLLLAIASLPDTIDMDDLARIVALAKEGPTAGLHLLVAGWPPPPFSAETTQDLMPLTTALSIRGPYGRLGAPSGFSFSSDPDHTALGSPVTLDSDPPAKLIDLVCRELADMAQAAARLRLADLLSESALWTEESTEGLATTVGFAGDSPVILRFNDLVPNWMVGGRAGAGKSAFLLNIILGLATRYSPEELAIHALAFRDGSILPHPTPFDHDGVGLPHLRLPPPRPEDGTDPHVDEYGLTVLRALTDELDLRAAEYERIGATKFADARAAGLPLARIVCVIDEFPAPAAPPTRDPAEEPDPVPASAEAMALLENLARKGRGYGIHLILSSRTGEGIAAHPAARTRDSLFAQFPVRIALPGGSGVLDPRNDAAAGLPIGAAVVNTAGGFGGPRGATRGHETTVHFPDPYAQPDALHELGSRIRRAGASESEAEP